jgi:hypothetical protein
MVTSVPYLLRSSARAEQRAQRDDAADNGRSSLLNRYHSRRLNGEAASHAYGTDAALAIRSDLIWKPMENVTWITLEICQF